MPNYKNASVFTQLTSNGFDTTHLPGQLTPSSGIYRCVSCGFECVSTQGHPLPPESACTAHSPRWKTSYSSVRWQLVAAAIHTSTNP
jgi:hypothetical protein